MRLVYTIVIVPGEPDEGGYWVRVPVPCLDALHKVRRWRKPLQIR